jgi:glycosyltransferase involved in cell wall biosynthesis
LRIAYVTAQYPPDLGGIQIVVSALAIRMARAGHEVEVLAEETKSAPRGVQVRDGVTVRRFSVPVPSREFAVSPSLLLEMRRRRHDFDLVHAHNFHALPALGAAIAGMRPLVFTPHYHGVGHTRKARAAHVVYRPLTRLLFRACDQVTCVSQAEAKALTSQVSYVRAPLTVVPNGVDAEALAAAEPFEGERSTILVAGRMESYKQFDRVVLAFEALGGDAALVILGEGPEWPAIERLVASRGLSDRVRLLGRVPDHDARRWFRTAKVLVSLSRHEAAGLTLFEALAAGTPVVASDIPAHRETAQAQPTDAVRLVPTNAAPETVAASIGDALASGVPSGVRITTWDDTAAGMLNVYRAVAR